MPTREKRARMLGVPIEDLPDGRGKGRKNPARGTAHYRWNGGRIKNAEGYVKVRVGVTHPLADANGYVYEHTLVAVAALGRRLRPDETVHHRSGQRDDNFLDGYEGRTGAWLGDRIRREAVAHERDVDVVPYLILRREHRKQQAARPRVTRHGFGVIDGGANP